MRPERLQNCPLWPIFRDPQASCTQANVARQTLPDKRCPTAIRFQDDFFFMQMNNNKRLLAWLALAPALLLLQHCKAPQTATADTASLTPRTYAEDIAPVMLQKCAPCHFPDQGRKKMLDTYEAVSANMQDIIDRVMLPADDIKFMPFKSKKPPLTPEELKAFQEWFAQGMPR
jgi:hypothetical protein